MRKKSKKIFLILFFLIVIIVIGYFGIDILQTAFYGVNEVECSYSSINEYSLDCNAIGAGKVGNEFSFSNTPILFQIDNTYQIISQQFDKLIPTIKRDNPSTNDFFINTKCKNNGEIVLFNGVDISNACNSIKTCSSFGLCAYTKAVCTSDADTSCHPLCYYPIESRPSTCKCVMGYQTCDCSLLNEYNSKWSNSILKASLINGYECEGFQTNIANPIDFYDVNAYNYYFINSGSFADSYLNKQLIVVSGNIVDVIDNPSKTSSFKTYGFCNLHTGICNVNPPFVDTNIFQTSHAQITNIKVYLKLEGYDENNVCVENGIEKCVGEEYYVCENSIFINKSKVDGKCGYVFIKEEPIQEIPLNESTLTNLTTIIIINETGEITITTMENETTEVISVKITNSTSTIIQNTIINKNKIDYGIITIIIISILLFIIFIYYLTKYIFKKIK